MHIRDFQGKHVHFIGIGGISMSGLAEILIGRRYKVTGSDAAPSRLTRKLEKLGAKVFIGQKRGQHCGADLIVRNSAILDDNEELMGAREDNAPVMERAELLSQIMDEHDLSVGISGMHGKTTCTSMTTTILIECGLNPTVHIGSELDLIGGATHVGSKDIFIAEACEYKDNFLSLNPNVEVILNIDRDHLDYFKDLNHIISSYSKYIEKIPPSGKLIANGDDPNTLEAAKSRKCDMITFGFDTKNDFHAINIKDKSDGCCDFDLVYCGKTYGSVSLSAPGRHNIYNALAAIAASHVCGCDIKCAMEKVEIYSGAKRRFEYIGINENGAEVYHDYAHHPTEVKAALQSAKARAKNEIICVFQPHTYTRTKTLFDEFSKAFDVADHVIFVDIYAAREKDPGDIHSRDLCGAVKQNGKVKTVCYMPTFQEAAHYANAISNKDDLIITVGAGTIEKINSMICE